MRGCWKLNGICSITINDRPTVPQLAMMLLGRPIDGAHATSRTQSLWPSSFCSSTHWPLSSLKIRHMLFRVNYRTYCTNQYIQKQTWLNIIIHVQQLIKTWHLQILMRLSQPPDTNLLTSFRSPAAPLSIREPGCAAGPQLTELQPIYRHVCKTISANHKAYRPFVTKPVVIWFKSSIVDDKIYVKVLLPHYTCSTSIHKYRIC